MAGKLTASEVAAQWASGVKNKGVSKYKTGIERGKSWKDAVSQSETQARWEARLQEAIQNNSWSKAIDRVSNEQWKQAATTRGAQNYAANTARAESKYQQKMQPVLDVINATLPQIEAMPKTTFEESMARSQAMARALYDAKRSGQI